MSTIHYHEGSGVCIPHSWWHWRCSQEGRRLVSCPPPADKGDRPTDLPPLGPATLHGWERNGHDTADAVPTIALTLLLSAL